MHNLDHPRLNALIQSQKTLLVIGIVYPCDQASIEAAQQIHRHGMARVLLVGPTEKIQRLADQLNISLKGMDLADTPDDPLAAAAIAVSMAASGACSLLMKGGLHTEKLLAAVVSRNSGIRTSRRISHLFLMDIPRYHKLLAITDCAVNISPDLNLKKEILINAIHALHAFGIAEPKVGILAAVASVNPAMPATTDAAQLVQLAKAGQLPKAIVEGPFGFDNAISAKSAAMKGIASTISGDPDLLLLPDLQAANIFYKSLVYLAGAECAGLVLGAKVPIVLTSRADSVFTRLASVAFALRLAPLLSKGEIIGDI
jgi:phosphate acetyltransferase